MTPRVRAYLDYLAAMAIPLAAPWLLHALEVL